MQVHHFLEEAATNFPQKQAVWDKNRWFSYQEINDTADCVAAFLTHSGIKRGDRAALLLENSYEYIISYFGILKAGAVVVGLSTDVSASSITRLLSNSEASCLFSQYKYYKNYRPALGEATMVSTLILTDGGIIGEEIPGIHVTALESIVQKDAASASVRTIDTDLAEIVYTSGSTNTPKGVMLTHLNLVSNTRSICKYLRLTREDRMMVVLPFFYIYGKSLLLTHFYKSGSLVIENQFIFPNKILELMNTTEVTGFAGVPSTFSLLLNRSTLKSMNFPKLRYVTQAGGSLPPTVQDEVADAFAPAQLFIMYGTTEASPRLSYLNPDVRTLKRGSVGVPVDNVDLLICDPEGNELPRGEEGEIAARGSNIMKGYWKDSEETAKVLKNGMYFTGDLGKQDEDGFFYITGRVRDIVKVKGIRISPVEIEEILLENRNILEAAVLGIEDPLQGESLLAVIVPRDPNMENELLIREFLKAKLPPNKQPRYIQFRTTLPKNKAGKIMKTVLKQEYGNILEEADDV